MLKTYPVNSQCRPFALTAELQAAGVNVLTVRGIGTNPATGQAATAEVVTDDAAVDATVNVVIAAHDGSTAATDAASNFAARPAAQALLADPTAPPKLLRALALTLLDELNLHAAKLNAILTAVDGAATFAALKIAIAAIADYPARTAAQVRTAILGKIGTGDADQ